MAINTNKTVSYSLSINEGGGEGATNELVRCADVDSEERVEDRRGVGAGGRLALR